MILTPQKSMRWTVSLLFFLLLPAPASAVLYDSVVPLNELPSSWNGFFQDLRALRDAQSPQARGRAYYLRQSLIRRKLVLEARAGKNGAKLTEQDVADLGAIYLRLGESAKALELLRTASQQYPRSFVIHSHLAVAWIKQGNDQEALAVSLEAKRLTPEKYRLIEEVQRQWIEGRVKNRGQQEQLDQVLPDQHLKKTFGTNLGLVQRLLLSFPEEGRLLWFLGEMTYSFGDKITAARILEGCVVEYKMKEKKVHLRRSVFQQEAAAILKQPEETHPRFRGFRSQRPLVSLIDNASLPQGTSPPYPLPWIVLSETTHEPRAGLKVLPYLQKLEGKSVLLQGYMKPFGGKAREFLLIENPVGCWFCQAPPLTETVAVQLSEEVQMQAGLIEVLGTLSINRENPEAYFFYLEKAKLKKAE